MSDEEEEVPQPKWEGPYDEEGVPHGQGVLTYPPPPAGEEDEEEKPSDKYEGMMEHGKRQGKGRYTWGNGSYYDGEYVDNKKHGAGVMTFPDKGVYEGQFAEDRFEGTGTFRYGNGDLYMGSWSQGKKDGDGMYYFKEQECQFIGKWSAGAFASGKWIFKDGSVFDGKFNGSSCPEGPGEYFFAKLGLTQAGIYKKGSWDGGRVTIAT